MSQTIVDVAPPRYKIISRSLENTKPCAPPRSCQSFEYCVRAIPSAIEKHGKILSSLILLSYRRFRRAQLTLFFCARRESSSIPLRPPFAIAAEIYIHEYVKQNRRKFSSANRKQPHCQRSQPVLFCTQNFSSLYTLLAFLA